MKIKFCAALCSAVLVLTACQDPHEIEEVREKTVALEQKIEQLELRLAAVEAVSKSKEQAAVEEKEAQKMLNSARAHVIAGSTEDAKKDLLRLLKTYPKVKTARYARQTLREVELIGQDAGSLDVEKWFFGSAALDDNKVTVLIFWEAWCPHCKREVPKLEALYQKYNGQGLGVIGLTKVSRSSTDEQVEAFIDEYKLSYPMAKENNGTMSKRFAVSGVPAAAVVVDGKVVWRGHPARLADKSIQEWLEKPAS